MGSVKRAGFWDVISLAFPHIFGTANTSCQAQLNARLRLRPAGTFAVQIPIGLCHRVIFT
jgi:hypothetical protein